MAAQPPPTRVCPHCSTLAQTAERRCPFCGRSYRRRSGVAAIAALLLVQAALVLGGVFVMLTEFGDELDGTLDDQVDRVERDLDRDLDRVEDSLTRRLREELDARLPAVP